MSATNERDAAMRQAQTDFRKALLSARKVSDGWYRCQALAEVARFAPDGEVESVIKEALKAAAGQTDSYKRVAITAWPLRALLERGKEKQAAKLLPAVLDSAAKIENTTSRSDALFLIWKAFYPTIAHKSVLGMLVNACAQNAKGGQILEDVILMLASTDPTESRRLAANMPEGRYKRRVEARLAERQKSEPSKLSKT